MFSIKQTGFSHVLTNRYKDLRGLWRGAPTALLCLPLLAGLPSVAGAVDISFKRSSYTVNEGDSVDVVVVKDGAGEVSVKYESDAPASNYTDHATAGTDYTSVSGTLNFGHDDTEKTITLSTKSDTELDENAEALIIKLSDPEGADLVIPSQTAVVILNVI